MTDDDLRAYAADLITAQAQERDHLSIFEVFEEWGPEHGYGAEIDDEDADRVSDLIQSATITVTWPEVAS